MNVVKVKYIDPFEGRYKWSIDGYKESDKLSSILDYIKREEIIGSLKEFAESIGENSVGLNDLKKGRKKISIKHIINMNKSYPFINTDYILLDEGLPFNDDFLIKEVCGENYFIKLNLNKIKELKNDTKSIVKNEELLSNNKIKTKEDYIKLYKDLLDAKNKLLEAKNEIIKLIQDKKTCKRLGSEAIKSLDEYKTEVIYERWKKLIQSVTLQF